MSRIKYTREEALAFHLDPIPGKLEVNSTVPMSTQRDLSLAYSPGVAVPCEVIAEIRTPPMTTRPRAILLP